MTQKNLNALSAAPLMRFSNSVYLTAAIAHLPLLFDHVRINWGTGHYQFFPLFIAVIGWLIFDRLCDQVVPTFVFGKSNSNKFQSAVSAIVLGLCCAVLLFAVVVQYWTLVIPSMMLLIASWIIGRYGTVGFFSVLPAWLLLFLVIPIPWNMDAVLVNRMQFLASGLASWILDSLGQIHFRDGLILVTSKNQFFTEEACSGIQSLFSSLAAISAFCVLHRFPVWRCLFNWTQVVLWVVVGNAIRIAIVVYVADNWTEAIASGAYHDLLGIGVFGLIMILALSTNRAVDAFQTTLSDEEFESETAATIEGVVQPKPKTAAKSSSRYAAALNWAGIVFFGLILVFGVRLAYVKRGDLKETFNKVIKLHADDLPAQIDGWQVVNFEQKIRPPTSLLAPSSFIWTLKKGVHKAVISLDGPYHSFHDLSSCYRGLGWYVKSNFDRMPNVRGNTASLNTLAMNKRNQHGIVIFSAFDGNGRQVKQSDFTVRKNNAWKNILMALGRYDSQSDGLDFPRLPISQIQLTYERQNKITDYELEELEQLYCKTRELFLDSKRFAKVME